MLTVQQAKQVVDQCIRRVTGFVRKTNPGQRLSTLGIKNGASLKRFKSAVMKEVRRQGHKIAVSDLKFGQGATVAAISALIAAKAQPVEQRAPKPQTKPLFKKAYLRPPFSPGPKGAKKKAAKKKQAKALVRGPAKAAKKAIKKKAVKMKSKARPRFDKRGPRAYLGEPPKPPEKLVVDVSDRIQGDGVIQVDGIAAYPAIERSRTDQKPRGQRAKPPLAERLTELSAPSTRTVECTPQLEIREELPAKVYRMAVFVDQGPAAPGADVQPIKVKVPKDLQQFPLDVWLDCSSHFSIEEVGDPSRVTVITETGVSDELAFTLKMLNAPDDKPMFVSAFFRYNGRPSGKITRSLELANGSLRWKKFVASVKTEGEVVLPKADGPGAVVVETLAKPAEVRVEVLKTEANDGQHYTMKCYTPQGQWEGAWNLPQVTKDLVNTHMQKFMANQGAARIASLEGAGMAFWDALPDKAQELLWDALEKEARTMSVVSQEPYIPWELMVPYRKIQSPRKPLGIELQLGRWITGDYQSARQRIPMKNGYVICPKTSGLTSATTEVTFLTQQLKPDFAPADQVQPADFNGVNKGLGGPPRNVIHFICHGKSASLQTLELDKPDTLDCSQVRTLKGFQAAFRDGPLAFLNACEVGGQVMALDGVGGFANSFIELGASAVVAPLWSVQDKVALDVTQTFYPQALKGVPFAEIMKQIRAKAYQQAIDSYAAYCFYGDPMAAAG